MATETRTQHTPGEWGYAPTSIGHPDNALNIFMRSDNGTFVARIASSDAPMPGMSSLAPDRAEALANARLIAASPDLLAAAEAVMEWILDNDDPGSEGCPICGIHSDDPNNCDSESPCSALRIAIEKASAPRFDDVP